MIIVGLGNPGTSYERNRHNAGCMFVDFLAQAMQQDFWTLKKKWATNKSLHCSFCELDARKKKAIICKPNTYMNRSGLSVRTITEYYKAHIPSELIVAHDDLDIPLGKFRIVHGYGPKSHNGIEHIESTLKTKDFLRIRIGIDNRIPEHRIDGITYVLQNFIDEEQKKLHIVFSDIYSALKLQNAFA